GKRPGPNGVLTGAMPASHRGREARAEVVTPRGRRRLAFCAASVALFLSSAAGRAHAGVDQWTSNGPYGGTVWAVAIDPVTPTRLYAGTPGGIFRSTDGGASWSGANSGLSTSPYSIVIDPSAPATLYAGGPAADGGVFKSTDGAASWNKTSH